MFYLFQCIKEQTLIRPIRDKHEWIVLQYFKAKTIPKMGFLIIICTLKVPLLIIQNLTLLGLLYVVTSHRYMSKGIRPEHIIKDTCI